MKVKTKQLFSFIMTICMCLSLITLPVYAVGNVAKIGDVEYATLQDAVNHASDRTTITLLTNCADQNVVFPDDKAIIIDRTGSHFPTGKVGENLDATMKVYDATGGNAKIDKEETEIYGGFDPILDYLNDVPRDNFITDLYKDVKMTKDQIMPNNVGHSTTSSITICKDLTFDLNGFELKQANGPGWNNYPLICVNYKVNPEKVTLIINDSSEAKTGRLSGVGITVYINTNPSGSTVIQNGGTICCDVEFNDKDIEHNYNNRIPVRVEGRGVYEMNGGTISSAIYDDSYRFVYVGGSNDPNVRPKFIVHGGNLLPNGSVDVPEKVFENCGIFVEKEADFIVEPASGLKFNGGIYSNPTPHFDIASGLFNQDITGTISSGYGQDVTTNEAYNIDDATAAKYPYIILPQQTVTTKLADGSVKEATVLWGNKLQLDNPTPPSENIGFGGWKDVNNKIVDLATTAIYHNYDLYPIWTGTVTYQWADAPSEAVLPTPNPKEIPYEHSVSDAYTFGRQFVSEAGYYTFSGWYLDEALTNKAPATIDVNENVNLYGSWTYHSTVDKHVLEVLYNQAKDLNENDYTTDSYCDFDTVKNQAQDVLSNPNATQEEVNEQVQVLDARLKALVKRGDTTVLNYYVTNDAVSLDDKALYEANTWAAYENAMNVANTYIANNSNITQEQVDTALKNLIAAKKALVRIPIDFTALDAKIMEAINADKTNKTDESIANLANAIAVAQAIKSVENITQADVDAQVKALDDAIKGLVSCVKMYGYTLTLDGKIGVNYYVDMENAQNKEQYSIRFSVNGETKTVPFNEKATKVFKNKTYYRFTCPVAAKQMTDNIEAVIMKNDTAVSRTYTYSVKTYRENVKNRDDVPEETKELLNAMLTFGAYAQKNFSYNEDKLAIEVNDSDLNAVTAQQLSDYEIVTDGTVTGLKSLGVTLSLDTDTLIRMYITPDAGVDLDSYTFTVDGEIKHPSVNNLNTNGFYYLDISSVPAQHLDKAFTISVSDNQGNTKEIKYSALTYAYNVLSSSEEAVINNTKLQNLVKAMYLYYLQAEDYFNPGQQQ